MNLGCMQIGVELTLNVSCVLEVWMWSWLNWLYMCKKDGFMIVPWLNMILLIHWMHEFEDDWTIVFLDIWSLVKSLWNLMG